MNLEDLRVEIIDLLFSEYVPGELRARLRQGLPTMSEADLVALRDNLKRYVSSQEDLAMVLTTTGQVGEEAVDVVALQKNSAARHPLFDLLPEDLARVLAVHAVDYLKRGIDLRAEYELYLSSVREILEQDPFYDRGTSVQDVRLAFLAGLTECKQVVPNDPRKQTLEWWLKRYDTDVSVEKKRRGGFEQLSFVKQQNLPNDAAKIVQEALATYDYLLYTDALVDERLLADEFNAIVAKSTAPAKPPVSQPVPEVVSQKSAVEPSKPTPSWHDTSLLSAASVLTKTKQWTSEGLPTPRAVEVLFQAAQRKDRDTTLAALRLLVERGALVGLVKTEPRVTMAAQQFAKRQTEQTGQSSTMRTLQWCLRQLVEVQLGLSEVEAAHVGAEISTLLRKDQNALAHLAYYDMTTQTYQWHTV